MLTKPNIIRQSLASSFRPFIRRAYKRNMTALMARTENMSIRMTWWSVLVIGTTIVVRRINSTCESRSPRGASAQQKAVTCDRGFPGQEQSNSSKSGFLKHSVPFSYNQHAEDSHREAPSIECNSSKNVAIMTEIQLQNRLPRPQGVMVHHKAP